MADFLSPCILYSVLHHNSSTLVLPFFPSQFFLRCPAPLRSDTCIINAGFKCYPCRDTQRLSQVSVGAIVLIRLFFFFARTLRICDTSSRLNISYARRFRHSGLRALVHLLPISAGLQWWGWRCCTWARKSNRERVSCRAREKGEKNGDYVVKVVAVLAVWLCTHSGMYAGLSCDICVAVHHPNSSLRYLSIISEGQSVIMPGKWGWKKQKQKSLSPTELHLPSMPS